MFVKLLTRNCKTDKMEKSVLIFHQETTLVAAMMKELNTAPLFVKVFRIILIYLAEITLLVWLVLAVTFTRTIFADIVKILKII